jgi:hypothetical protein
MAEPLQMVDVMPTALYVTGLAIPEDVDGRVVTEMFEPADLREHRVLVAKVASVALEPAAAVAAPAGQDADILARMKALGYLE